MKETILVAYDFSDAADGALVWAAEYAKKTGAQVRLLHVVVPPLPAEIPTLVATPYPTDSDLADLRKLVGQAATKLGIEAQVEVTVSPNAADAVVMLARETGANLIVMGTHGRGPIRRAILGSAADYVVRHAECPVVTIRGPLGARKSVMDSKSA